MPRNTAKDYNLFKQEKAKLKIRQQAIAISGVPPCGVALRGFLLGLNDFVRARVPAGRWGKPTDFTGAAIFLASSASDFVTADYIRVDGGFAQGGNTPTPFNE